MTELERLLVIIKDNCRSLLAEIKTERDLITLTEAYHLQSNIREVGGWLSAAHDLLTPHPKKVQLNELQEENKGLTG